MKSVWNALADSDSQSVYEVFSSYLQAFVAGLRIHSAEHNITNPTLFRAATLTFPDVAQRVADRFEADYTIKNFETVLRPLFQNVKRNELLKPGASHVALNEIFRKALSAGFSLGKRAG